MKKCPFCSEEIQDEAIKCRYCGSLLDQPPAIAGPVRQSTTAPAVPRADFKAARELARQGNQTNLIRLVRDETGWDLKEATAFVGNSAANGYDLSWLTHAAAPGASGPPTARPLSKGERVLILFSVFVCLVFAVPLLRLTGVIAENPSSTTRVMKKDGTFDARENDLQILCEDWRFYRDKIIKLSAMGDEVEATKARQSFQRVNGWLNAYRDEDVAAACGPH